MFGAWNLQTSVGLACEAAPRFMIAAAVGAPVLHFLAIGWAGRIGHARRERSESAS